MIQILTQILIFITFIGLIIGTISNSTSRTALKNKSREDWLLDSVGLLIQGIIIPLLQITVIYQFYHFLLPNQQFNLKLPSIIGFIISFIIVDYLYYWNHRLLHSKLLWKVHQTHHTVTQMDVLGTSRNTLWASLLIIYLWIHALFLYLLANPAGYLLGVSLTSALDLWRHSQFIIPQSHLLYPYLSSWLILPQDHRQHHARIFHHCNYGANFKLWDKIHGTFIQEENLAPEIGITIPLTLAQKLLFPFNLKIF